MSGKMARNMAQTLKMATLMALLMAGPAFAREPLIDSVCLVTDVGRVDDGTFNQGGYEGMLAAAADFGLETAFIETTSQVDYESNLQTCIDAGHDAIITMGFLIADATLAKAQANPDVYFIGVDHFYSAAPANLVGLQFREDQAGFLAGALAGLMTESDVVAGVYGIDIPPVVRFRCGFEQGVAHSNAPAQALGVHVPSFIDPATGAETALQFIAEDADVILGAGGTTGSGAIRAAAAENVYVIGVDQDEYHTTFGGGESPGAEYLITSALKRVDQGVYLSLQALVEGDADTFHGEEGLRLLDAASEGVGLAPPHDADVPDEALAQLDEIFAALQDGSLGTGCDPVTGAKLETDDEQEDSG